MTKKEAIKALEHEREWIRTKISCSPTLGAPIQYKIIDAINMAIEALEKQIPKKFSEFDSVWCPSCGENVFDLSNDCSFNYCPYCGHALDWEGEDDD